MIVIALDLIAHNVLLPAEFKAGTGPAPLNALGLDFLRSPHNTPPAGLGHYASAVAWIATAKLHFIVCLGALIAACVRLSHFFERQPDAERRSRQWGVAVMTLIPLLVFVPFVWSQGNTDMFQFVLQATKSNGYAVAMPFIDGLGILTTACLAAVASQLTYPIVERTASLNEKTAQLALKMQLLRFLLYVGMVVLVSNIVQVWSFLEQVHGFLIADPARGADTVKALAKSLVASRSVLGTLLLAAVYLPASFFLKEEAYRLAEEALPGDTPSKHEAWLKEHDLSSTIPEMLPRFAAILAPLIAGPLADLASRLPAN